VLFLSVPYSTGWSATVDGVATPIIKANVGFSGVTVSDGKHRVDLRYQTPGAQPGIVLSLIALALAGGLAFMTERRIASDRARTRVPTERDLG
jgi:uncharacterized membrane protein YfhO